MPGVATQNSNIVQVMTPSAALERFVGVYGEITRADLAPLNIPLWLGSILEGVIVMQ